MKVQMEIHIPKEVAESTAGSDGPAGVNGKKESGQNFHKGFSLFREAAPTA